MRTADVTHRTCDYILPFSMFHIRTIEVQMVS